MCMSVLISAVSLLHDFLRGRRSPKGEFMNLHGKNRTYYLYFVLFILCDLFHRDRTSC